MQVPFDSYHDEFAIRFRALGFDDSDNWYVDDIRLGDVGLRIMGAESAVTLDQNVICENDVDLQLLQGALPPELAGNEVCT